MSEKKEESLCINKSSRNKQDKIFRGGKNSLENIRIVSERFEADRIPFAEHWEDPGEYCQLWALQ